MSSTQVAFEPKNGTCIEQTLSIRLPQFVCQLDDILLAVLLAAAVLCFRSRLT
jgi:hypothetical protein